MENKKLNINPLLNCNDKYLERQRIEEELEKNATILIHYQKLQKISSFTGYFEFLHNNFLTPIYFEGSLYPSVTHAYHAARSSDENTRKAILNADSFNTVAQIARRIVDPLDWSSKRLKFMEQIVRDKFRRSKELQEKLKATEKRELVMTYEEETPGNLFWGISKNKGQNQLGRILMKIREDIINNKEIINWITTNFELISEPQFLPEISFNVNKENKQIEHIILKNKPFYKFGLLNDSDVILAHTSISRLHAIIVCDKNLGIVLIDLRSKAGTKLDNDIIKDNIPYRLKDSKKINFAMSTRDYIISIDFSKVKKIYEREKNKLNDDLKFLNQLKSQDNIEKKGEVIKQKIENLENIQSDTVFVSSIPQDAVEKDIRELLEEQFGLVKNINWPNNRDTGFKKSFMFVKFESIESARQAVDYGLLAYDLPTEEVNEDYDILPTGKKSFMLKIKFAEKDKYIPKFTQSETSSDNPKSRKQNNMESSEFKKKYKKDLEREYTSNKRSPEKRRRDDRHRRKRRRRDSSSSDSKSIAESSDYYSNSSSDSKNESSSFNSQSSESNSSSTIKKNKSKKSRSRSRRKHK